MKYDITLMHIINSGIGGCKRISMGNMRDCVYALRGFYYVKDNDFSSKFLWKHVTRVAKLLFAPGRQ